MIADKVFNCIPGDAVFINNREFHVLRDATPLTSDWRFINLDPVVLLAGWLPPSEPFPDVSRLNSKFFTNVIHEQENPGIVFMVRQLISELENEPDGYRSVVRSLVWGLLVMLQRQIDVNDAESLHDSSGIQRVYPALRYIAAHYGGDIEMEALARRCHCSLSTFRRVFKQSIGCLPLEYLNEYRLKVAAATILSTDRTILEISVDSGFPTLSSFNRHFKDYFKETPSEYRKRSKL